MEGGRRGSFLKRPRGTSLPLLPPCLSSKREMASADPMHMWASCFLWLFHVICSPEDELALHAFLPGCRLRCACVSTALVTRGHPGTDLTAHSRILRVTPRALAESCSHSNVNDVFLSSREAIRWGLWQKCGKITNCKHVWLSSHPPVGKLTGGWVRVCVPLLETVLLPFSIQDSASSVLACQPQSHWGLSRRTAFLPKIQCFIFRAY